MGALALTAIVFGGLFLLLGTSLWIAVSMGLVGMAALYFFTTYPVGAAAAELSIQGLNSFALVCLPLFIFMGEILYRGGVSKGLYDSISPWVAQFPGRLLHTNIIACTIFAAVSGSSTATAATIGSVSYPELTKQGYKPGMVAGSLAGTGTLGIMIPPSFNFIIFGVITGTSIGQLYIAGIFPGLMIASLFVVMIAALALVRPDIVPPSRSYTWKERLTGLVKLLPMAVLIVLVLGVIYTGVCTVTESAALGVVGAIFISLGYRALSLRSLREALLAAVRTTCMMMFIYIGARILASVVGYLRIPMALADVLVTAGFTPTMIFVLICVTYLIAGCVLDALSFMLLSLPIFFPLVVDILGFDPVWFGVTIILLIEIALLTPPIGFNLFVIQGVTGRPLGEIAKWASPFVVVLVICLVILYLFPEIALFLPGTMMGG